MMRRLYRLVLLVVLIGGAGFAAAPAQARSAGAPTPGTCFEGTLPHGALSMYCIPARGWNGDLVVYAHGYVAYNQPLDFQNLTLPGNIYVPRLVQRLGYAFATTSYRQNGLAILEGVDDIRELVAAFPAATGQAPNRVYIVGGSEGGIVTTLSIERNAGLFAGGLAACGPIGSFQRQLDYIADFRVLFDYFFPGVLPGSAIGIPQQLIDNWDDVYLPRVTAAVNARPRAAAQLIATSNAPIDPADPAATTLETITSVLWYSVFATNDAAQKLGGNPYGNRARWYSGSDNDALLNARVARFNEDASAKQAVRPYETSGNVTLPLITIHTTGDQIIPYWHEPLYTRKVVTSYRGKLTQIPVQAYGHCNFTAGEIIGAFALLVMQTSGRPLENVDTALRLEAPRPGAQYQRGAWR